VETHGRGQLEQGCLSTPANTCNLSRGLPKWPKAVMLQKSKH
jgi:hypothetical protein